MTVVKTYLLAQLPSGAKLSFWRLELPTGAFTFFFKNSCHQKTAKLCFYRHHRPQFIWKGTWVWQVEQQNKRALMKCPKSGDLKIWDPESKKCNQRKAGNGKPKETNWRDKQNWRRTRSHGERSVSAEEKRETRNMHRQTDWRSNL